MRFDTSQHMRLSQQMKLAPRMIQSMEILQMPMLALQERIEQELETNVALEQGEVGHDLDQQVPEPDDDRMAENLERGEMVVGEDSRTDAKDWERLSVLESSYGDAIDNEYQSSRYQASSNGERDRKMDAMANVAARSESLTEQLTHQWTFAEVDEDVRAAGEVVLGYVAPSGLLGADLETILEQNLHVPGLTLTAELLERAVHEVQQRLDPPGIAARDVRECLLLQVDEMELREDDAGNVWEHVRLLVRDHFDDLLQNRLPKISQDTGLTIEQIQRAVGLMRRLNRSPGRDLVDENVPTIAPDVVVEFDDDSDTYVARLAHGILPPLRVSKRYERMSKDRAQEKDTRDFLQNSVRNATWLIESIQQRSNTLLRVVNVVLARQREYFDHGPQHLRPLPMIEVADQLGIHVGTVSRAVAEKYLQTPRGLVPLRRFFSGGTSTDSGRDMSWEAVKETLREIIDAEDKAKPMSDEALAGALKERGIDIARRTVVKYRQQMGIPPARRRKVFS